jgi:beta-lactamase class A
MVTYLNRLVFLLFLVSRIGFAQDVFVPDYLIEDHELSKELKKIVKELHLHSDFKVGDDGTEQISLAVIDLNQEPPRLGGVNFDNFIYPASVYKIYVAAEILNQISLEKISLTDNYIVKSPNDVDKVKEIPNDPRPLLCEGDSVTINYLLDLMITRSDNSAANCLIDIAKRSNINILINTNHWLGSEVTRKFLGRKLEDPGYRDIRGTMTCALHAADFMYKVYSDQLVNPWVSKQMKALLGRQLDKGKLATGLPDNVMYYNKTGWWSFWTNDVGIVDDGSTTYIISCFMPLPEDLAKPLMQELSKRIYTLIKTRQN